MQRVKHTVEFKAEAVMQVVDKWRAEVDVSERLGLSEGTRHTWVRKFKATEGTRMGDMLAM